MRDGIWNGKSQATNFSIAGPNGLRVVLEERGVNTHRMRAEEMRHIHASHADLKNEMTRMERFVVNEKSPLLTFFQNSIVN